MQRRFKLLPKRELRQQLAEALARYTGPVRRCPPGRRQLEDDEQKERAPWPRKTSRR